MCYYPIYLINELIVRFVLLALYFATKIIILNKELLDATDLLASSIGFKIGIYLTALTKYN